jgi:3-oxoacyl-[acyl-carrier protein] reductase
MSEREGRGMDEQQQRPQRVALVTGGAVGLGRAIALRLAADGAAVAIAYHSQPADDVVAQIEAEGGVAIGLPVDVTDRAQVDRAVEETVRHLGRLDILVNNAGGLLARVAIEDMTDEHWQRILALNLTSAFYCSRAAIPYLGQGGRIINVSSLAAKNGGGQGAAAYAAAKAGLIGFTRASAKELGVRGVTVNAIAPGFIGDTPFHTTFSSMDAQRAMIAQAAVGRAGDPGDIAALVAYLASPDSGFVTGTVTDINGGSYFS